MTVVNTHGPAAASSKEESLVILMQLPHGHYLPWGFCDKERPLCIPHTATSSDGKYVAFPADASNSESTHFFC
jgi:hypothetical protein